MKNPRLFHKQTITFVDTSAGRVIPRDQTPAERLRRLAISMMREMIRQYPKEATEIVKELLPEVVK